MKMTLEKSSESRRIEASYLNSLLEIQHSKDKILLLVLPGIFYTFSFASLSCLLTHVCVRNHNLLNLSLTRHHLYFAASTTQFLNLTIGAHLFHSSKIAMQ